MTLPGADQLMLHSSSDVQSVHGCQVSPRHPELFVCIWSPDQHWSLEIMEPNQSLGICTSGIREEFIQAMEQVEIYGHNLSGYFKNSMYLSHSHGKKPRLEVYGGGSRFWNTKMEAIQRLRGLFWKKSAFGLKICVVNYLFSPWCRQVIPLTLMDNFMAANNICS